MATLALVARGVGPVALALLAGGLLLLALGRDPLAFYGAIYSGGLTHAAWQDSVTRMAPLLLIAAGLIVAFRASLWNLGYDGQFLLAATLVAGFGPATQRGLPTPLALIALCGLGAAVGGLWALVPALLRALYGVNEIITTLMMSFIGVNLANLLIKGPFQDSSSNVPQTGVLPLAAMLPSLPGTRIHVGIVVALGVVLLVHYTLSRTALGLRLEVLGASPRAAAHVGVRAPRLIVTAFVVSGALVGLAAAVEILGVWGYVRTDWNPAFGDAVIPFVFLARLHALRAVPFIAFYAILSIGGEYATQQAGLPTDFLLVLIGLILLFMTITEYLGRRRGAAKSYLPASLSGALGGRNDGA